MKLAVKAVNEDGSIIVEGKLNQAEIDYLLQFSINGLMAMGAQFMLEEEDEETNVRINFSGENPVQ